MRDLGSSGQVNPDRVRSDIANPLPINELAASLNNDHFAEVKLPETSTLRVEPWIKNTEITEEMIAAIAAAACDFNIRIFTKQIEQEVPQYIILAGEVHIKSSRAGDVGRKLIGAFQIQAYEAVNHKQDVEEGTLLDKALYIALLPLELTVSLITRGFHGSSIEDVVNKKGVSEIARSTNDNITRSKVSLPSAQEQVENSRANPKPSRSTTKLWLEEGTIKPTLMGEGSKFVCFGALIALELTALAAISKFIPHIGGAVSSYFSYLPLYFFKPYVLPVFNLGVGAKLVSIHIPEERRNDRFIKDLYKTLGFITHWILTQREERMVKNLNDFAENGQNRAPILAVFGRGHMSGMSAGLRKDGWSRVHDIKTIWRKPTS